jgi:phospholipid/cholesterol/gamma-HCH transport system ATP-binding protein
MLLQLNSLSKSFSGHPVLTGITVGVPEKKLIGLIGPSGGGKSTLLKILGQVLAPDDGQIDWRNLRANEIALMFQEGALFDSLTVSDNAAFPLADGRVPTFLLPAEERRAIHCQVDSILERVGLLPAAGKLPQQLSGGMRRRASLARALVGRPRLVLLDDPTCGLDPVAASVIMELVVELHREKQAATIIVSHDLRRLLPVVDLVWVLAGGGIAFAGTVAELAALARSSAVCQFVSCRYDLDAVQTAAGGSIVNSLNPPM